MSSPAKAVLSICDENQTKLAKAADADRPSSYALSESQAVPANEGVIIRSIQIAQLSGSSDNTIATVDTTDQKSASKSPKDSDISNAYRPRGPPKKPTVGTKPKPKPKKTNGPQGSGEGHI